MSAPDRLTLLLGQNVLTGIDFVSVVDAAVQTDLDVYFLLDPATLNPPLTSVAAASVSIVSVSGGERIASVPVVSAVFQTVSGRTVLRIHTSEPGDFSIYRLRIDNTRIDRFFNDVDFSFKQACDTGLDCAVKPPDCPPQDLVDFPVDYLARDFESFRSALFDFARQRHPDWTDSVEADVGVMLLELMSALGDELSYVQDQYARESHFVTATQRHSIRRHARLIDYQIHDGRLASTALAFTVGADSDPPSFSTVIAAGSRVAAIDADGTSIVFEVGQSLEDRLLDPSVEPDRKKKFAVQKRWNQLVPHIFDASATCLDIGATTLWVEDPDGAFTANASVWNAGNKDIILESAPADPSLPKRAFRVTVTAILESSTDPLAGNIPIVRIEWSPPTTAQLDLESTVVLANIVPAVAGETVCQYFSIGDSPDPATIDAAVEREGLLDDDTKERTVIFRVGLRATELGGLGFLGSDLTKTIPEIHLQEITLPDVNADCDVPVLGTVWEFFPNLLEAGPEVSAFTVEDGMWRRVIGFQRNGQEFVHVDYASNAGYTLRFGDGDFGALPDKPSLFQALYRLGPGAAANVADNVLTELVMPDGTSDFDLTKIRAVRNPLPTTDGVDPESIDEVKQLAPEAYQAVTFRAVRPEDYREAAERLDFVQRANATFRWTGSWLSAFVTVDPEGSFELTDDQRTQLEAQLDCFRQAGREVVVRDPIFANIDLKIHVCVEPFAFDAQVKDRVLEALFGKRGPRPKKGFFDPDNFTFGTPLLRSNLEAAIQNVEGVRAVLGPILIRRRNVGDFVELGGGAFTVGNNEVIRLQNDPEFPERGTVDLQLEGGA
jgi:hypothetical protein